MFAKGALAHRACLAFAASAFALGAQTTHAAEPARPQLLYRDGTGSCADEASFRARLVGRLGRDPFAARSERVFRVSIARDRSAWVGRVDVLRSGVPQGSRSIRDTHGCDAILDGLATVTASLLDVAEPGDDGETLPALPPPTRESAPKHVEYTPKERDLDDESAKAPRPKPTAPPEATLGAFGSFDATLAAGLAPGPTIGGRAGAAFRARSFSIGLEGGIASHIDIVRVPVRRVDARVVDGSLVPCGHLGSRGHARLCGVVRLGSLATEAPELPGTPSDSSLFFTLGARAGYAAPLGSGLTWNFAIEAFVPLTRTRVSVNGDTGWQAPAMGGALATGIGFDTF